MLKMLPLIFCFTALSGDFLPERANWESELSSLPRSNAIVSYAASTGRRVRLRLVEKLTNPTAGASVSLLKGSDEVFVIEIRRSLVSTNVLAVALRTLTQFARPKSTYPDANIVVYVPERPSPRSIEASERARLDNLVAQLRSSNGSFLEIDYP